MSQPALPPFNLKNACRKCGHAHSGVKYVDTQDVLSRTCKLCSYGWDETPLDRADREKWARFIERHSKK